MVIETERSLAPSGHHIGGRSVPASGGDTIPVEDPATGAIIGSIAHFRGHAQEIVGLTRCQLGESYQFQWTPLSPEEGVG